jgi:hypothetical protein
MSDVERKKMSEKIILYFKSCVKIRKHIWSLDKNCAKIWNSNSYNIEKKYVSFYTVNQL